MKTTIDRPKSEFLQGIKVAFPIWVAASVFGLFFGASANEAGLSLFEIFFASATMFAGASQFVFLEVYGYRPPAWSIVLAVFAVNFRHVLYSASLGRHMERFPGFRKYVAFFFLVDPVFADCEKRVQTRPILPSFYYGYALLLYVGWIATSLAGALFGSLIEDPSALGLDLFISIYFMALLMGFRSKPGWMLVVVTGASASFGFYHLIGPPWHISLGALAGILAAVFFVDPKPVGQPLGKEDSHA